MADQAMLAAIRALIRTLIDNFWLLIAMGADAVRGVGPLTGGITIIFVCAVALGVAHLMQRRLNKKLSDKPAEHVAIWLQELMFSLPAAAVMLVLLPVILLMRLISAIVKFVKNLFSKEKEEPKKEEPPPPVLVATLGPSFLAASLVCVVLYAVGRLMEPLLAMQLGLSSGAPAWQYLMFGHRPELAWYLPLSSYPFLGALAAFFFWLTIWWWSGRVIRTGLGSLLGSNLVAQLRNQHVLRWWRTWFGSRELFQPDDSYRAWANWLTVVAMPLFIGAWVMLGGDPYRSEASMLSVSLLVWLSWSIHLNLRGLHRPAEEEVADEESVDDAVQPPGWPEVLADLELRYQVLEPFTFDAPRRASTIAPARHGAERGVVSELLLTQDAGLVPESGLSRMQVEILETLSRQAFVHVDPPLASGTLALGQAASPVSDRSGLRHRNQIVLAPEGAGKTTLAMLAACNQALIHTESTLVVLRDEDHARAFESQLRQRIEPSTLRWTIRTKLAGGALISDLGKGIVPDIVVASLHELVTGILDDPRTYAAFLKNLGLIIVDDAELFCGPIEMHTQLAFRRLILRLRELQGTPRSDQYDIDPVMLVLCLDSMLDTATWAKTLCGIDGVTRTYGYATSRERLAAHDLIAEEQEDAEDAEPSEEEAEQTAMPSASAGVASLADAPEGTYHLFYQLSDFVSEAGDRVRLQDLIRSCERASVPWHYRRAGDLYRHTGRALLRLAEEPQHDAEDPADALVIFVEGALTAVRREIDHLCHAGTRATAGAATPVAFISVVDPDERMALTELNPNSSISAVIDALPRPVVRPPFGRAVEAHLSTDLVDTWMEVADIIDVFGLSAVRTLSLLSSSTLVAESIVDLDENQAGYEKLLHVRLPAKAVAPNEEAYQKDTEGHLLPPRVAQVTLPPGHHVAIRDRTNLNTIDETDFASAHYVYYKGRVFENAQGRYIVTGIAGEDAAEDGSPLSENDILVEPFLNDDLSSPRRRTFVRPLPPDAALPGERGPAGEEIGEVEPVFIGDFPIATVLAPVQVETQHLATFRLTAQDLSVRQRHVLFGAGVTAPTATVRTVALGIIANPDLDVVQREDCPKLQLRDARLISAAMRAILQSAYRGAELDVDLALHIDAPNPAPEHVLGPRDGFYLFDPHLGGNGAARAVSRDGVEPLLRLCRVYIERVLVYERLRARFDWWGDEDELLGRRTQRVLSEEELLHTDRAARRRALIWLDSRLRPEGSLSGGRQRAQVGVGGELGEGDVIDYGRCWYSHDGRVTDLVWTKHRWLRADQMEAMCDVGIGRKTVANSRIYAESTPHLQPHLLWLDAQLATEDPPPAHALRAPHPVRLIQVRGTDPLASNADLTEDEAVLQTLRLAVGVVCDSFAVLKPLAELLRDQVAPAAPTLTATQLATDFVQGIPFASDNAADQMQGPIHPLLVRLGNHQSQSLLLACLLKHLDVDSGVFLDTATGKMLAAAALPDGAGGDAVAAIDRWRTGEPALGQRAVWAERAQQLFVPIDPARYQPVGVAPIADPETWVFLPLTWAWVRLGVERGGDDA